MDKEGLTALSWSRGEERPCETLTVSSVSGQLWKKLLGAGGPRPRSLTLIVSGWCAGVFSFTQRWPSGKIVFIHLALIISPLKCMFHFVLAQL